jgi:homoserine acetyltransferase
MNIIRGNKYSYKQGATQALLINHQNDGIYTGRTNRRIPALLPSEGNRRAHIRGPKGHLAAN